MQTEFILRSTPLTTQPGLTRVSITATTLGDRVESHTSTGFISVPASYGGVIVLKQEQWEALRDSLLASENKHPQTSIAIREGDAT